MQFYDFENSIGFIINSVAKAFVRALDSELREHTGVTIGQWKVMVMLVRQNGLTQKEIADRLNLKPHSHTNYRQDGEGWTAREKGRSRR